MRKIFFVLDYKCNNLCISCARKRIEKGGFSFEEVKKWFNKVKPEKYDLIELSGGEPTLRGDIIEICKFLKSNFRSTLVILSNGRRFKDKEFARKAKDAGVDRVMTTFYSHKADKHDSITRVKNSFAETLEGLKNLQELGVELSVKTIILKQNYKELDKFVDFAFDTFPNAWVSIHGLILRGIAKENYKQIVTRYSETAPYIEKALDVAEKHKKNIGLSIIPTCTIDPYYWKYCNVGWKETSENMIYISPEEQNLGGMEAEQPAYCKGCLITDRCSWAWESAWKEYIELFGTGELKKVK